MNSKTILKEVREAIKSEKYSEAIEKCEDILKEDPKNYMAYLFLGAANQTTNKIEAAKHLRKAVDFSPGPPTVALQGLANCAPSDELPSIYDKLLTLLPDKAKDYYEKLYELADNSLVAGKCLDVFKRAAQQIEGEHQVLAYQYLAKIWVANNLVVDAADEMLYKTALETLIKGSELSTAHFNAYKNYLKLLYRRGELDNCMEHACRMVEMYPGDVYAYEWVCKIFCENHNAPVATATWRSAMKLSIDDYVAQLLQLNEQSSLALLIQAIELFKEEQFVAARGLLYKVQSLQPNYSVAVNLLAHTEMALGAYGLAEPWWLQLGLVQYEPYAVCLSHSLESEKWQQGIDLLLRLPKSGATLEALARCYFKLSELEKLQALELPVLLKAEFVLPAQEAVSFLQTPSLAVDLDSFEALLLCGKLQIQLSHFEEALNYLLKATRLRPHRAECFYHLGKIYYATADIIRSRKCFEKSVYLNPLSEEAVNNLSAIYQQLGEEDLNRVLLLNTLKYMKSASSKRVHYKLGLHYLNTAKWDDAIQSFRLAIKFDVGYLTYWESLGDAYCERGSYNSAVRVFQKILEFDSEHLYAKLQIALIKTIIRRYAEAIPDFDALLQEHPDYLPGLKGVAEAHIGLAHNLRLEHRYGRCKEHLQLAVNHLQKAFLNVENRGMVWLWRLMAGVFMQTTLLPSSMANLLVNGMLVKREAAATLLTREELVNLALRFYTCALKLKQDSYLWYELALCAYRNAELQLAPEEARKQLNFATNACKMAIKQQGSRWQNWNLLGVIHMDKANENLPLAQHCFVQALILERKSYPVWTNLGILYLNLGDVKLANQAFQRAQQSNPIYPNAWIGQAIIAEAIGEEEEALDLFRHCQQFQYHPESALGYAHWVCAVLVDPLKCEKRHYRHAVDSMYADVVALDAINWYSANAEDAATLPALSFQAFLNVRQRLYGPAERAYLHAVQRASPGAERDKIYTNLGYLYLRLKKPALAIDAFNNITQATFKPIIGLALAYYRAEQHQEAYSVFTSVLKSVADSEDDKAACILVAMAAMVYASQGEADTKTILYQCILRKDTPIQALYSACALGILHEDSQLTETILSELKKYEAQVEYCAHIGFLHAQYYLTIKQPRRALTYLMQRVHIHPHCAELRKVLADFLLDYCAHKTQFQVPTSQIALSAIELTHRSKTRKNDCVEDARVLLLASRALSPVDKNRSSKLVQRAIHLHPQNSQAWQALLAAR